MWYPGENSLTQKNWEVLTQGQIGQPLKIIKVKACEFMGVFFFLLYSNDHTTTGQMVLCEAITIYFSVSLRCGECTDVDVVTFQSQCNKSMV